MQNVHIDLGARSYDIRIGDGILGCAKEILPWIEGKQAFVVTNSVVAPLYLETLKAGLGDKQVYECILPDGEEEKNMATLGRVLDVMLEHRLERSCTVIALGGGVIGDIAGFAASCYQRGVNYIQVPTTLLAQVDSSVGGKTGVNHPLGKNMIGAFYQPKRVIIDPQVLKTLDDRQFSAGMAEVIKYGLIRDQALFSWLEENVVALMAQDSSALEHAIGESCLCKADVVEQDEREGGVRALLNLGHTFGHAVEAATGYGTWLHGEAVGLGMAMAAFMSKEMGLLTDRDIERSTSLLQAAGLKTDPSAGFAPDKILHLMGLDKKVESGTIRLILLNSIGDAFVSADYPEAILRRTLDRYCLG